ncbi:hypothetical protein [Bosea sp. ASV33]|uniref:hypothetical protein n=1 Tax=Bosea sp. ASV33 TaxID=2795106 RepID=UPI0018EA9FB5|nr:hypothetical protein [Bosea sp. ASV33]
MTSLETRPFTASSSWNTPLASDATFTKLGWPSSTGYNYSVAWDGYSPSVYVASASDPLVQVTYPAGWGYPGGTISVHMPAAANGAAGTDGELVVIDGDIAYNFWQFKRTSTTTASAVSMAYENIVTGDGWGSSSPFLAAGITAVGASQLGGLIVQDEVKDGSIDHALQLVVDGTLVKAGAVGQAISSDGGSASGIVKEGQLLGIPPGTPMPAGLSPLGQQVFKAMQQYGAYVVDVAGGVTNVRAQANAFDDATMTQLWHDMGSITPLLQGVSGGTPSGNTGGSSGGNGTNPPVTTPPVVTPPVTTPPVTTPPTGTSPDTTKPTVQWVAANGPGVTNGTGTVHAGDTVRLTLKFSEAVNVSGTPTLSLNDKGTAKYVSGAGTDTLQFEYKVAAGQNTADLAISAYNLSGVKDKAGNALSLSGAPYQPAGTLVVDTKAAGDTTAPKVQWIAATGSKLTNSSGTVGAGDTVRLSVNFNEVMTVDGTPTLSLNSKGTAKYVGGAGTSTLQFDYKVQAGEKASDLEVSSYNLNGVKDQAGNAVNVSGAPHQPAGTLVVNAVAAGDTTAPKVQWIAATGSKLTNSSGTVGVGDIVRLSVNFNEVVTVNGTPTLSLNSKGTAKYVGGAGTSTLQFDYKVQAGEKAADLEVSSYNLNGVRDRAGNAVNVAGAPHQPAGTLAVSATTAATVAASQPTTLASATDLVAPAAPAPAATGPDTAATSPAAAPTPWSDWFGGHAAWGGDFSFGNRRTVGYPGAAESGASASDAGVNAFDGAATAAPAQSSAMSRLALLDQYAASSFAIPATGTTAQAQDWLNNTAQTLAKAQA